MIGILRHMNLAHRRRHAAQNKKERGLAAVEMALIAPVFFMMFMGIVEVSLVMLVQHLMENATFNASRIGKIGYITSGKTQLEMVTDKVLTEMGSLQPLVNVSKITISATSFGKLSDINQPGQGVANNTGTAQQVVVYTVTYPWKFFTPMIGSIMGDENYNLNLSSRIVVRNEPYE